MKGFLELKQQKKKITRRNKKIAGCNTCGLYLSCKNPKLPVIGNGKKKILIVNGCPTKREDLTGDQTISTEYKFLEYCLDTVGINIKEDCWKVNAVRCYSKENNEYETTSNSVSICRLKLLDAIEELKPNKIIVLGELALNGLIGHRCSGRMSTTKYNERWWGWKIPDQELETLIFPVFHPSFVLEPLVERQKRLKEYSKLNTFKGFIWNNPQINNYDSFIIRKKFFIKDLKRVADSNFFGKDNLSSECGIITDVDDAICLLNIFYDEKKPISFDYETTGLKPYAKGHKIFCIGISNGIVSFGMPIFNNNEFLLALKRLLQSRQIGKISHNMKFEEIWTRVILGYEVKNWLFDTMLSTHILDSRTGVTGLKFQTYVNLGILGYDDEVDQYISGEDEKNANSFNSLNLLDIEKVCKYCAEDAHYTHKIYSLQYDLIMSDKNLKRAYTLFHEGALAFVDMEERGIKVDEKKLIENSLKIEKMMMELAHKIYQTNEIKIWKEHTDLPFNFQSPKDLATLFYTYMGLPCTKFTKKGNYSTDAEALTYLHSELAELIIQYSKLKKIQDYLEGFKRETVDGVLHGIFNLNTAKSYRSSSNAINLQNLSSHDPLATELVMGCLLPWDGQQIAGVDQKSLEVQIGCCVHKDPMMISYLLNPESDMHKDLAEKLFLNKLNVVATKIIRIKKKLGSYDSNNDNIENIIHKNLRFIGKNGMSFPLQYGDAFPGISDAIWNKHFKDYHREYFKSIGINNYEAFKEHIRNVENWYWNEQYPEFGKWREENWKKYLRKGFVSLKTGFKCTGLFRKNQVNNFPIQGPGFHIVLYALIEINKLLKKGGYKTKLLSQIHDALYFSYEPSEWEEVHKIIKYYMVDFIKEKWDWVTAPIGIDIDFYQDNWYNKPSKEK